MFEPVDDAGPASAFLGDFFTADSRYSGGERQLRYFTSVYVSTPGDARLANIIATLAAKSGPKVVLVDGHPRSGKTFLTAAAISKWIHSDPVRFAKKCWWTAGIDCRKVYDDPDADGPVDDVPTLANKIAAALEAHPHRADLQVVLLDDILGTNVLRPLGDSPDRLLPYFQFEDREANPWLRHLSDDCVLVITSRSLFFFVLESLLGSDVRGLATKQPVHCLRWGMFRPRDLSKVPPWGFDSATLEEINLRTWKEHPLLDQPNLFTQRQRNSLVIQSSPMTAFTQTQGRLTPLQKTAAAYVLFGEDLCTLADQVDRLSEGRQSGWPGPWHPDAGRKLRHAYAVAIAPGLVFLGDGAYTAIGLSQAESKSLAVSLYYTDDDLDLGRLPNEYYMVALNDHFGRSRRTEENVAGATSETYTASVVRAYKNILLPNGESHSDKSVKSLRLAVGLVLRGLIERARYSGTKPHWDELRGLPEFQNLLQWFHDATPDGCLLLTFEEKGECIDTREQYKPGLAAAISWALYKLDWKDRPQVGVSASAWFLQQVERFAHAGVADTPNDGRDWQMGWSSFSAFYSSFLQWAIQAAASGDDTSHELLRRIVDTSQFTPEARADIEVILRDEFSWALLEECYSVIDVGGANLGILNDPMPDPTASMTTADVVARVNLYFTLAWHNRWLDGYVGGAGRPEADAGPPPSHHHQVGAARRLAKDKWLEWANRAHQWQVRYHVWVTRMVREKPYLLDFNLEYHWRHFVTQKAQWMRDWSYQEDPLAYEQSWSEIAEGSPKPTHNEYLADIADILIGHPLLVPDDSVQPVNEGRAYYRRIRNILFLVATRAGWFPRLAPFLRNLGEKFPPGDGVTDTEREVNKYVLEAVFELHRQGMFEPIRLRRGRSEEGESLLEWCRNRLAETHKRAQADLEAAWQNYLDTLQKVTHDLDLLPPLNGWRQVLDEVTRATDAVLQIRGSH
ncbi:MAG TPA: hypothetical protein VHR66_13740 [Gemmataceae bacterium]|nr:hypothetical protein [Gemmataceae bacterium]